MKSPTKKKARPSALSARTGSTIPLFDGLKNKVYPQRTQGGIVFSWSRKGIGFGQLTLTVNRGKLIVDAECMGPDFCADVVKQAIVEALSNKTDQPRA
jgi:hypothetical protein